MGSWGSRGHRSILESFELAMDGSQITSVENTKHFCYVNKICEMYFKHAF